VKPVGSAPDFALRTVPLYKGKYAGYGCGDFF
jgi:hypothetical protein